uniref:Cyclin N-terminal domain-containing protein n=1 Tax=Tetradesmus obliquus TaxID=3088 RepID=A0A383W4K9_TETOB|eukprot:jgi/Sobl393_1/19003/SZX72577.1
MATMRQAARITEENAPKGKPVKPDAGAPADNTKRRAFGDIGNIQGVTTRAQAAKDKVGTKPQTSLRPRDPNATAAALRSKVAQPSRPAGVSLSSLLQTRAESVPAAKAPVVCPESPLPDIDKNDKHNPLAASEYANSIYNYYRRVEPKFKVAHDYMQTQCEINEKMRGILVDWLVEVHLKFKLMPETLYLTCNIIDRYLSIRNVTRKRLQLVGVTAMLIASKYEEIWAPEVNDFVYISDKAYTREDILAMEKQMLASLQYDLTVPTCFLFTARFRKAAGVADDLKVNQMCEYLSELCLVDVTTNKHSLSLLSAAVLHVALTALGRADTYPRTLARHARYKLEEVLPAARHIVSLMRKAPESSLRAVYKKHCSSKFGEVAKVEVPVLPEATEL